jgi:hypothetical protein
LSRQGSHSRNLSRDFDKSRQCGVVFAGTPHEFERQLQSEVRNRNQKLANLKTPGLFADGGNLYFRVAPGGARGWILRYAMHARTRDMGLGAYPEISLGAARKLAGKFRELIKEGVDPIERRRIERAAQPVEAAKSLTFDDCVRTYIADHEAGWRNAKHRMQWSNTLAAYASPIFGKLPVSAVDSGLVLRALKAIWLTKPETASRLRGRIESVLDWARVHGYRGGETQPAGRVISTICCRPALRYVGSNIIPPCPTPKLAPSWQRYAIVTTAPPSRCSS